MTAISLKSITKSFAGAIANDAIDLDVSAGEIHALLGENGAGKSTLMNILTGLYQPDSGSIFVDGREHHFSSPAQAIAAGIGMVHQHFKLIPAFTVAENIYLGWSNTARWLSAQKMQRHTAELAAKFGLAVPPEARVEDLSAGEQQRVEILKNLVRGCKLLILDEPTAVLTPDEAELLLGVLRQLAAQGTAIIFISHKLDEVLSIADRITVLRAGRKVATHLATACSQAMLAGLMVGHDISPRSRRSENTSCGAACLQLHNVVAYDDRGLLALNHVNLTLHAGEILAIAGVAGNGQRELTELVTGLRAPFAGEIILDGKSVSGFGPAAFLAAGVGHIPQDRLRDGLAPALSIIDNVVLRDYKKPPIARGYAFNPGKAKSVTMEMAQKANVRIADPRAPVRNLSGGNQQKLVAEREVRVATKILVAATPTRGLDIGAVDIILNRLQEMRDSGVAVLLVSEDLDEAMGVADRIAVLFKGQLLANLRVAETSRHEIGQLMGGQVQ